MTRSVVILMAAVAVVVGETTIEIYEKDGSVVRRVVPITNYTYVLSYLESSLENHHWIHPNPVPKELLLATEVILKKPNKERPTREIYVVLFADEKTDLYAAKFAHNIKYGWNTIRDQPEKLTPLEAHDLNLKKLVEAGKYDEARKAASTQAQKIASRLKEDPIYNGHKGCIRYVLTGLS